MPAPAPTTTPAGGLITCGDGAVLPAAASDSCQDPAGTDSPRTDVGDGSTIAEDSEPPSTGEAAHSIAFTYTDSDGWTYSGSIPVPDITLSFSKDVSSSPPGQAQLVVQLNGTLPQPMTFADTNPGRPNGPTLDVGAGGLEWPVKLPADDSLYSTPYAGVTFGPCALFNADPSHLINTGPWDPNQSGIVCSLASGAGSAESPAANESDVDQLVNLALPAPQYVFSFGSKADGYTSNNDPSDDACNFYVDTVTGAVTKALTYDDPSVYRYPSCGQATVTFH